ncbi:hypothetical protein MNBD_ALPHA03-1344 [hydrothermal vent metagenome]|uniref:DOT1 domain-containing protein n=1 Tax=hydrothermal vent metagenome TaxID=652676 RepID=A0A3B1B0J5_9ZZZZ
MAKFIRASSKKRGFFYSLRIAVAELSFDFTYQTDTITIQSVAEMSDVADEDKANAVHYQPSYVWIIARMFKILSPLTKKRGTFVDLGSGKGRVMMVAALQGYCPIIGVEFSKSLTRICENNIENFKRKSKNTSQFETITMNVINYEIPLDTSVVFLGNPFNEHIMKDVLTQIDGSLQESPRDIYIAYFNPLYTEIFLKNNYQLLTEEKDPSGTLIFQIFRKAADYK